MVRRTHFPLKPHPRDIDKAARRLPPEEAARLWRAWAIYWRDFGLELYVQLGTTMSAQRAAAAARVKGDLPALQKLVRAAAKELKLDLSAPRIARPIAERLYETGRADSTPSSVHHALKGIRKKLGLKSPPKKRSRTPRK